MTGHANERPCLPTAEPAGKDGPNAALRGRTHPRPTAENVLAAPAAHVRTSPRFPSADSRPPVAASARGTDDAPPLYGGASAVVIGFAGTLPELLRLCRTVASGTTIDLAGGSVHGLHTGAPQAVRPWPFLLATPPRRHSTVLRASLYLMVHEEAVRAARTREVQAHGPCVRVRGQICAVSARARVQDDIWESAAPEQLSETVPLFASIANAQADLVRVGLNSLRLARAAGAAGGGGGAAARAQSPLTIAGAPEVCRGGGCSVWDALGGASSSSAASLGVTEGLSSGGDPVASGASSRLRFDLADCASWHGSQSGAMHRHGWTTSSAHLSLATARAPGSPCGELPIARLCCALAKCAALHRTNATRAQVAAPACCRSAATPGPPRRRAPTL